MTEPDDPLMDAIGRYWDALVQRESSLEEGLDLELVETIAWTISRDDAPLPDAHFVRQLEEYLMPPSHTIRTLPLRIDPAMWMPWNGHAPLPVPVLRDRMRLAPAYFVTAALVVLTLAASLAVFGPGRPRDPGDDPVVMPAVASPRVVSTEASPTVISPPAQPTSGPGGADGRFADVVASDHGGGGKDAAGYWLFEPAASGTEPLPVVVFLHQQGEGQHPMLYRAWIDHLVRRGAIVIYPSQISMSGQTRADEALGNVREAIRAALSELQAGEHARPDVNQVAMVGHGPGATLAADYAATAQAAGLPVPGALLLAFPSGAAQQPLRDIRADTRVVIVAGGGALLDEDAARRLWTGLTPLPDDHRAYVRLIGDEHGVPPLEVWHYTPMTSDSGGPAVIDALDWYGTWKLLDRVMACAFTGQWCEYALGHAPEQRFMGTWSDGVPVSEAQVLVDPGTPAPP